MKAAAYTIFALVCFALNSILCRLALKAQAIDAASFTAVRLISGAVALFVIYNLFGKKDAGELVEKGSWLSAFFLFAYAVCFSFAYVNLTTGTGALILFGSVQATMIAAALFKGERPCLIEWCGITAAFAGLVYLVFPGLDAPPLFSSLLMASAGISWGFYTLRGKESRDPLAATTGNFVRAAPMILPIALFFIAQAHVSSEGILYAVLSGAIASGVGYSVWYAALKFHTATRAAILQLSVPLLAAFGGIILLSEILTIHLILSSALILGGIGLAVFGKNSFQKK